MLMVFNTKGEKKNHQHSQWLIRGAAMTDSRKKPTKESYEIHYSTKKMQLVKNGARTEMEVSELVEKGQLLASLVTAVEEEKYQLIAGENCELSATEESLLAGTAGYPHHVIDSEEKTCMITIEPLINISSK